MAKHKTSDGLIGTGDIARTVQRTNESILWWAKRLGVEPAARLPNGYLRWRLESVITIVGAIQQSAQRRFGSAKEATRAPSR